MLAYVPKLYRDELFCSVTARYHRHVGNISFRDTSGELFGDRFMRPTFDLPSHLARFVSRVPVERRLTVEGLALEHTHLRYYTACLPAERRAEALRRMIAGERSLHITLGLNGFLVPAVSALRFCRSCLEEMEAEEGEWWWRRAHQLPGVLVCPDHGCPLSVSTVNLLAKGHHSFAAATARTCPEAAPLLCPGEGYVTSQRLQRIAEESARFLDLQSEFDTADDLMEAYRNCLWETGYVKSRRIDVSRLLDAFCDYWGPTLELFPGIGRRGDWASLRWLLLLCRKHENSTHPLLHVLFRIFVEAGGAAPCRPRLRRSPFGDGPWKCPNPEAYHGENFTIFQVTERRNNTGMLTGLFECPCGYAYTMSISDAGTLHGPRFRRFGPLLEPALRRLVEEGETLTRIAAQLGLSRCTVRVEAARLGLSVDWKSTVPEARPRKRLARRRNPARKVRRRLGIERARGASIDWSSRDREWASRVSAIAAELLALRPLVRVCRRSIEARLDRPGCIYVRETKVPLTVAAVAVHEESLAEFRRRRIHSVIDRLREEGRRVTVPAVTYWACVGREWRPYVEEQVSMPLSDVPLSGCESPSIVCRFA